MGLLSLLPNAGSALVSIAKQLNTQPKSSYPVSATTPWLPLPGVKLGTRDKSGLYPTPTRTDSNAQAGPNTQAVSNTINRPTYDYSMPEEEPSITWEESMNRARAYFEPQYKSAVLSQNKLASDQQKRLTQALAARGYANARGGHRLVGEGDISQQHAMALENLRNQYDSLIGKRAWEIYSGEGSDAYNKLRTLLADRDAKNQLALQQYGLDLNAGLQRDQMRENSWNSRQNAIWDLAKLLAELEE